MPADIDDRTEDLERFRTLRAGGDPSLRDALIQSNLGLAVHFAGRYARRGVERDDLVQIATIGLVKAVDGFDPDRGVPFASFARPFITGEIRHWFRDKAWAIRVPRGAKDLYTRIVRERSGIEMRLGRPATPKDIADELQVTVDEVLEALDAGRSFTASSIDAKPETGNLASADSEQGYLTVERRMVLAELLAGLDEREARIIHLRFVEERSQSEIAEDVGVSQVHVSRLLRSTLAKMRAQMLDDDDRMPDD